MTAADSRAQLEEGRRFLDGGDPEAAVRVLEPLTRHAEPDVAGALAAWQQAANAGGATAWLGWRSVAEQLVRDGDLESAITAYREADRRAPAAERGPIANRIAWLLKETGPDFAARRQFNRARGAYATYAALVTFAIIAICVALFGIDTVLSGGAT